LRVVKLRNGAPYINEVLFLLHDHFYTLDRQTLVRGEIVLRAVLKEVDLDVVDILCLDLALDVAVSLDLAVLDEVVLDLVMDAVELLDLDVDLVEYIPVVLPTVGFLERVDSIVYSLGHSKSILWFLHHSNSIWQCYGRNRIYGVELLMGPHNYIRGIHKEIQYSIYTYIRSRGLDIYISIFFHIGPILLYIQDNVFDRHIRLL